MIERQVSEENTVIKPLLSPTLPKWWRVLPSLILIIIISNIDTLLLNDFIENRYATQYQSNSSKLPNTRELCLNTTDASHESTHTGLTTTPKNPTSTTMSPNDRIQAATASLNVYISLVSTIPAIFTSILLGSNSDRIGRKSLLVLPYFGKVFRYVTLTAAVYYHLSDTWILISILLDSVFGTAGLSILSSFAYISDCTTENTRTLAIIITDVCMGGGRFIPLLAMGIYLEQPRFVQSMVFTLFLSLAGLIFSIVLQPESNLTVQHLNIFQQLAKTKLQEIMQIFRVFSVKRTGHKQRSLLILVVAHLNIIVMYYGFSSINYLYLYGTPFCFDSFGISLTVTACTVAMAFLTILFTLIVPKGNDHVLLPIIGCFAFIAQLVVYGVANRVWMIYLAVGFGALYNVLIPVIRSLITKTVESNEYAVVFILASVFESGGSFAINAMVNEIYGVSLGFDSGFVFFTLIIFGSLAILLLSIMGILNHRSTMLKPVAMLNE